MNEKKPIGVQPRSISMKEITRVADEMKLLRESIQELISVLKESSESKIEWEEANDIDLRDDLMVFIDATSIAKKSKEILNQRGVSFLHDFRYMFVSQLEEVLGKRSAANVIRIVRDNYNYCICDEPELEVPVFRPKDKVSFRYPTMDGMYSWPLRKTPDEIIVNHIYEANETALLPSYNCTCTLGTACFERTFTVSQIKKV